jgi:hypothetical protein
LALTIVASHAQDADSFLRLANSHDARQWHDALSDVLPRAPSDRAHWTINVVENKIFLVEPDAATAEANAAAVCRAAGSQQWDRSWDVQGFIQGPGEDAATVRDTKADCTVK